MIDTEKLAVKCGATKSRYVGEDDITFTPAQLEAYNAELLALSSSDEVATIKVKRGTGMLMDIMIPKAEIRLNHLDIPAGTKLFKANPINQELEASHKRLEQIIMQFIRTNNQTEFEIVRKVAIEALAAIPETLRLIMTKLLKYDDVKTAIEDATFGWEYEDRTMLIEAINSIPPAQDQSERIRELEAEVLACKDAHIASLKKHEEFLKGLGGKNE